jgi:hypothetical protein
MKDKITPTPWKVDDDGKAISIMDNAEIVYVAHWVYGSDKKIVMMNANGIVSAVNNTYGSGINPEMVPKLLDALENILLDVTPANGRADTMEIPKVTVKIIRQLIDKAKL